MSCLWPLRALTLIPPEENNPRSLISSHCVVFFLLFSALQCDENTRSPSPEGPGALGNSKQTLEKHDKRQLLTGACLANIHRSFPSLPNPIKVGIIHTS